MMGGWKNMSEIKRVRTPATEDEVRALKLGDQVVLDGLIVMTAGIPTHQRLLECVEKGVSPPIDMRGATLLHFGGQSEIDGDKFSLSYINPTTSTRFNNIMPKLIPGLGLRMVGGKGGLSNECAVAMREAGCVYLSFIGGGCTLFSDAIREVVDIGWKDMLTHYRLLALRAEGLGPATVAIDAHGNSLYDQIDRRAKQRMAEV